MDTINEEITLDDLALGNKLPSLNRKGKKVLVVEDVIYVLKSITRILLGEGYFVLAAANAAEALALFKEHSPDLVTVDQKLPDMTGIEMVKKMRQMTTGRKPKIMFISAVHSGEEIRDIVNLGIDGYLLKPFKKEKLIRAVASLLK